MVNHQLGSGSIIFNGSENPVTDVNLSLKERLSSAAKILFNKHHEAPLAVSTDLAIKFLSLSNDLNNIDKQIDPLDLI